MMITIDCYNNDDYHKKIDSVISATFTISYD